MHKLILAFIGFFMAMGMAFAAVDLNSADQATLDGLKGIGPVKAKAIADERAKNGPFKNLDDVQARVKGIGPATVAAWKKDGSAVVGGGTAKADAKADKKSDKKPAKADAKADKK
ncbi:MAG TPA: helix-hairpin-helix domain-containing protein [Burkholderiales bacterium]|jgi:competence ComEA-like helix-hairpin-helix protein|nr:helix-hairpin-helix domain-containing protein [Burkholderiales bacterium]